MKWLWPHTELIQASSAELQMGYHNANTLSCCQCNFWYVLIKEKKKGDGHTHTHKKNPTHFAKLIIHFNSNSPMSCASLIPNYKTPRQHFSWFSSRFPLASAFLIKLEMKTAQPNLCRCLTIRIFYNHKMVLFLFYFRNSLNRSVLSCAVDPISQHVTLRSNIMTKEEIWEISINVTKKL